jgi:hypothetical protein
VVALAPPRPTRRPPTTGPTAASAAACWRAVGPAAGGGGHGHNTNSSKAPISSRDNPDKKELGLEAAHHAHPTHRFSTPPPSPRRPVLVSGNQYNLVEINTNLLFNLKKCILLNQPNNNCLFAQYFAKLIIYFIHLRSAKSIFFVLQN